MSACVCVSGVSAYIHTQIHTYIHRVYIHTYIHTYIHAYMHTCVCVCECVTFPKRLLLSEAGEEHNQFYPTHTILVQRVEYMCVMEILTYFFLFLNQEVICCSDRAEMNVDPVPLLTCKKKKKKERHINTISSVCITSCMCTVHGWPAGLTSLDVSIGMNCSLHLSRVFQMMFLATWQRVLHFQQQLSLKKKN